MSVSSLATNGVSSSSRSNNGTGDALSCSSDSGSSPRINRNKKIEAVSKTCRQMSDLSSSASDDYSSQGGSQEVVGLSKRRKSLNGMAKPSTATNRVKSQHSTGTKGTASELSTARAKTAYASIRSSASTNSTRPWKPLQGHKGDVDGNGVPAFPSEKPRPPWNSTVVPVPKFNPHVTLRSNRLPRSKSVNQVSIPIAGTGATRHVVTTHPQSTQLVQQRNLQNNLMNLQTQSNSSTITTLVLENNRLKEKMNTMGHIVTELQTKIDTLSSSPSLFKKLKLYVDEIAPKPNTRPDSKALVSQYLDLQMEEVSQTLRQMSDLSSGSDYSTSTGSQEAAGALSRDRRSPPATSNPGTSLSRTRLTQSKNNLVSGSSAPAPGSRPASQNGSRVTNIRTTISTNVTSRYKNIKTQNPSTVVPHQRVIEMGSTRPTLSNSARNPTAASVAKLQHPVMKPLRDRNRQGPIGKAASVDGTSGSTGDSALSGRYPLGPGSRLGFDGVQASIKSGRSNSTNTVAIPMIGTGGSDSHPGHTTNNNNQMVLRNLHNNSHNQTQSALITENTLLKEQFHQLSHRVYELQEQLESLSPLPDQLKFNEEQLRKSSTGFEAMSVVVQLLDLQRSAIGEKLQKVQARIVQREHELATERLKEVQALRLEFGRERECTKEELTSLIKKHEFEMREQACNYETSYSELKEQHSGDLEELRNRHKHDIEQLEAGFRQDLDALRKKHADQVISYTKQSPCDVLHKEIDSLEVVIEIRNQEIKDLRRELIVYKELSEVLSNVKDHNQALLAKVEDLEAQLEKTRGDKSDLMGKYQIMEDSMTLIQARNQNLKHRNDELRWRIDSMQESTDSNDTLSTNASAGLSKSSIELSSNSPFSDTE